MFLTERTARPSWSFLQEFSVKHRPMALSWYCIDAMRQSAPVKASLRRYNRLLCRWDFRLHELNGDPSTLAWAEFRPLRLSREEDWSDWLGWLFGNSTKGELAWNLFGSELCLAAGSLSKPKWLREEPSEDRQRRGDILLLWQPSLGIHIEVKVGDEQFEKTLETGHKLRAKHPATEWRNYVIIPDESIGVWNESAQGKSFGKQGVMVLLWKDVARGIRSCLWSKREPIVWRAWAWTFCGAIEQQLLGLTPPHQKQTGFTQFNLAVRWIEMMNLEKGRCNEC